MRKEDNRYLCTDEVLNAVWSTIIPKQIESRQVYETGDDYDECVDELKALVGEGHEALFERLEETTEAYVMAHIKYYTICGMRFARAMNDIMEDVAGVLEHYETHFPVEERTY